MWSKPQATEQDWRAALARREFANHVVAAASNALCAAKRFGEIYVGGDDTSCMLQVLASGDACASDVLTSVLLPNEEVEIAFTARGEDAFALVCSFWEWSPASPALISIQGEYQRVMCQLRDDAASQGYLCPRHLQRLQQSSMERLEIYAPREPDQNALDQRAPDECAPDADYVARSAAARAAVLRPASVRV
jgi:hypothetical protein